jgi:signal recognition particle subunit SRP54
MASRVLGMGDVVSLVERAQDAMKQEEVEAAAEKLFTGTYTLDDMLEQFAQVERMGPLKDWLGMIPGVSTALDGQDVDEKALGRAKAILTSMTPLERRRPDDIDASRRRRIARGSGASVDDVNRLLKSFKQMRTMMRQLRGEGGLMGKLADRKFRKMKEQQLRDLRRQGVSLADLGYGPGAHE